MTRVAGHALRSRENWQNGAAGRDCTHPQDQRENAIGVAECRDGANTEMRRIELIGNGGQGPD